MSSAIKIEPGHGNSHAAPSKASRHGNGRDSSIPDKVPVVCGPCQGMLLVKQGRILYQGNEMSPTEFERLGGKASAKKWKNSVRVLLSDGSAGGTIGDWLQEHGVDIRNNQVFLLSEGLPPTNIKASTPTKQTNYASSEAILAHLDKPNFVGLVPGDPTAELPLDLPAGQSTNTENIDLRLLEYDSLLGLSQGTSSDPFEAMLQNQPGVPSSRIALLTGQERKRMQQVQLTPELLAHLADYVHGNSMDPPWDLFGQRQIPVVGDRELDLQQLYSVVQDLGGYENVNRLKGWEQVCGLMDIDTSISPKVAHQMRAMYYFYLGQLEKRERDDGIYEVPTRISPQLLQSTGAYGGLRLNYHGSPRNISDANGVDGLSSLRSSYGVWGQGIRSQSMYDSSLHLTGGYPDARYYKRLYRPMAGSRAAPISSTSDSNPFGLDSAAYAEQAMGASAEDADFDPFSIDYGNAASQAMNAGGSSFVDGDGVMGAMPGSNSAHVASLPGVIQHQGYDGMDHHAGYLDAEAHELLANPTSSNADLDQEELDTSLMFNFDVAGNMEHHKRFRDQSQALTSAPDVKRLRTT